MVNTRQRQLVALKTRWLV